MSQRIVTMGELKEMVGQSFELEFTISNDEVIDFEDVTRVTETYRDSLPSDYPAGMIEGFHTLSMLDYLGHRILRPHPDLYWEYNYGLDRVRFPSPLISGKPMTLTYEVLGAEPKDKGLLMKYRATVVSAGATKPGMVAEWLALVMPRTTDTFMTKSRTQEKEESR